MSSAWNLDAIRAQFVFVRSAPPLLQQVLALASPIQIALSVEAADFGTSVPLTVTARIFVQGLGQGLPEIPLSFAVNGQAIKTNVFSDKNGQAAFTATLTRSGTYNLRVFAGPVDANNPAYGEQDITVAGISVASSGLPSVGFLAEQKSFSAPATLLFPFFAGGPSGYTLSFPPVVNQGTNNAWLLMAPSQYSVGARDDSVSLPYVLPTLSVSAPASVLDEEPLTISARITDQVGNPLPYQGVLLEFTDGRQITSLTADASGNASYTTSLEEGTYVVKASWEDLNYSTPTSVEVILPRLAVQAPGNVQPNQSFTYSVTSRTKSGDVVASLPLAVYLDGQFVKNVVTDGSGKFSDTLSLPDEGVHNISVFWKSLAEGAATIIAKNLQALAPAPTQMSFDIIVQTATAYNNDGAATAFAPIPGATIRFLTDEYALFGDGGSYIATSWTKAPAIDLAPTGVSDANGKIHVIVTNYQDGSYVPRGSDTGLPSPIAPRVGYIIQSASGVSPPQTPGFPAGVIAAGENWNLLPTPIIDGSVVQVTI